eukprot:PhM_4_TR3615/c0_g1_i1/m.94451
MLIRVALTWGPISDYDVDLCLACVIFDGKGLVLDCCYYNNLVACGGAVTHSGDSIGGRRQGVDEVVLLSTEALPTEAAHVVVTLHCNDAACTLGAVDREATVAMSHHLSGDPTFHELRVVTLGATRSASILSLDRSDEASWSVCHDVSLFPEELNVVQCLPKLIAVRFGEVRRRELDGYQPLLREAKDRPGRNSDVVGFYCVPPDAPTGGAATGTAAASSEPPELTFTFCNNVDEHHQLTRRQLGPSRLRQCFHIGGQSRNGCDGSGPPEACSPVHVAAQIDLSAVPLDYNHIVVSHSGMCTFPFTCIAVDTTLGPGGAEYGRYAMSTLMTGEAPEATMKRKADNAIFFHLHRNFACPMRWKVIENPTAQPAFHKYKAGGGVGGGCDVLSRLIGASEQGHRRPRHMCRVLRGRFLSVASSSGVGDVLVCVKKMPHLGVLHRTQVLRGVVQPIWREDVALPEDATSIKFVVKELRFPMGARESTVGRVSFLAREEWLVPGRSWYTLYSGVDPKGELELEFFVAKR